MWSISVRPQDETERAELTKILVLHDYMLLHSCKIKCKFHQCCKLIFTVVFSRSLES